MDWLQRTIPDWSPEIFAWFLPGLVTGIVICIVAWIGIRGWIWTRRKRSNQIHIPGDNGDVYLSERATRDIVVTSLRDFHDITVHRVQVRHIGKPYQIRVDFEFDPRMDFNAGKEAMKDKLRRDFREMIGVEAEIRPVLNVTGAEARRDSEPTAAGQLQDSVDL